MEQAAVPPLQLACMEPTTYLQQQINIIGSSAGSYSGSLAQLPTWRYCTRFLTSRPTGPAVGVCPPACRITVKSLSERTDLQSLAAEIVDKCKLIHPSKVSEVLIAWWLLVGACLEGQPLRHRFCGAKQPTSLRCV